MQTFFTEISKWRRELEEQSVDSGTTSDAIQLITYVQQLKKKTKTCQEQVILCCFTLILFYILEAYNFMVYCFKGF